ncbi:MAG TPA: hypothetical protein VF129_04945 [Actinomycetota bacterium]
MGSDPFSDFALGFDSTFGAGTIDRSRVTERASNGVTVMCAPVVGATPSNVCLWQRDDVAWVLVDFSGSQMPATMELAAAATAAA